MKTLIMMSSALAVAGFIILCQQRTTLGLDEFQLIHHQDADYKVFSYGFPWRVNDCDRRLQTRKVRALLTEP